MSDAILGSIAIVSHPFERTKATQVYAGLEKIYYAILLPLKEAVFGLDFEQKRELHLYNKHQELSESVDRVKQAYQDYVAAQASPSQVERFRAQILVGRYNDLVAGARAIASELNIYEVNKYKQDIHQALNKGVDQPDVIFHTVNLERARLFVEDTAASHETRFNDFVTDLATHVHRAVLDSGDRSEDTATNITNDFILGLSRVMDAKSIMSHLAKENNTDASPVVEDFTAKISRLVNSKQTIDAEALRQIQFKGITLRSVISDDRLEDVVKTLEGQRKLKALTDQITQKMTEAKPSLQIFNINDLTYTAEEVLEFFTAICPADQTVENLLIQADLDVNYAGLNEINKDIEALEVRAELDKEKLNQNIARASKDLELSTQALNAFVAQYKTPHENEIAAMKKQIEDDRREFFDDCCTLGNSKGIKSLEKMFAARQKVIDEQEAEILPKIAQKEAELMVNQAGVLGLEQDQTQQKEALEKMKAEASLPDSLGTRVALRKLRKKRDELKASPITLKGDELSAIAQILNIKKPFPANKMGKDLEAVCKVESVLDRLGNEIDDLEKQVREIASTQITILGPQEIQAKLQENFDIDISVTNEVARTILSECIRLNSQLISNGPVEAVRGVDNSGHEANIEKVKPKTTQDKITERKKKILNRLKELSVVPIEVGAPVIQAPRSAKNELPVVPAVAAPKAPPAAQTAKKQVKVVQNADGTTTTVHTIPEAI